MDEELAYVPTLTSAGNNHWTRKLQLCYMWQQTFGIKCTPTVTEYACICLLYDTYNYTITLYLIMSIIHSYTFKQKQETKKQNTKSTQSPTLVYPAQCAHVCSTQSSSADPSGPIPGNAEYKPKCTWWCPITCKEEVNLAAQGRGLVDTEPRSHECHPSFSNARISSAHIGAAPDTNDMHAWIDHNVHNLTKAHSIKSKPALHSQVPVYIQRNIHTYEASDPNGMNHDDHNFTKGIYTQIRYKHRPSLQH